MFSEDDFDLDIGDSNGPAYRKTEERSGPPLSYVAEKARHSIEELHGLFQAIAKAPAVAREGLGRQAWAAFRYAVVAYLALQNMLSLANDNGVFDRLLAMRPTEFRKWLDGIDSEGSVTG